MRLTRGGIQALFVVAIVTIFTALLLPAVQKVRESANSTRCRNNFKQVVLAVHNMHSTYNYVPSNPDTISEWSGTLQYLMLPYME